MNSHEKIYKRLKMVAPLKALIGQKYHITKDISIEYYKDNELGLACRVFVDSYYLVTIYRITNIWDISEKLSVLQSLAMLVNEKAINIKEVIK